MMLGIEWVEEEVGGASDEPLGEKADEAKWEKEVPLVDMEVTEELNGSLI